MKLTDVKSAEPTRTKVESDDPDAIRVKFIGMPPGTHDPKHPKNQPTGDLMPDEYGYAKPVYKDHPGYLWYFTSDKGFSMILPPHELARPANGKRYGDILRSEIPASMGAGPKNKDEVVPGWSRKGSLADLI